MDYIELDFSRYTSILRELEEFTNYFSANLFQNFGIKIQCQQPQHNDPIYLVDKICNKQQVQSFLDELICPICYEVIADPKSCKSCEKSFCALCITNWKKQYQQGCPCCRQFFQPEKPSKYFEIFLNKLIFSCINEEKGCNQQSSYSELKDHQIQCDYQIQRCSQRKCSATFLQKDKKQHLMQCPFENVECKGCLKQFQRKDLDFHQGTCNYLFKCQFCNKKLLLDEYKLHIHQCEEEYKKKQLVIQKLERPEKFDKYKKKQKSIKQFNTQPIYNKKNKYNYR